MTEKARRDAVVTRGRDSDDSVYEQLQGNVSYL